MTRYSLHNNYFSTKNASILSVIFLITSVSCGDKTVSRLTQEQLQNTDYLSEWASGGIASLRDGEYEERDYVTDSPVSLYVWLNEQMAFGDIDHDGIDDAVVLLATESGGSGTFYYLAAVINKEGVPENTAVRFLGDRVRVTSMTIKDRIITLGMNTHGPNDPMCCPTMEVVSSYVLEGDRLELLEP